MTGTTGAAQILREITPELVETVRHNVDIDWAVPEDARASLRRLVKRNLRKHGYPSDKHEKTTQAVLEQAEQPRRPHIKLLSCQQVIAEVIVQSGPDSLLPVADLRLLALEQVHCHMANYSDIVSSIASTNPAFVFAECHVQPPMQPVFYSPMRTHR